MPAPSPKVHRYVGGARLTVTVRPDSGFTALALAGGPGSATEKMAGWFTRAPVDGCTARSGGVAGTLARTVTAVVRMLPRSSTGSAAAGSCPVQPPP